MKEKTGLLTKRGKRLKEHRLKKESSLCTALRMRNELMNHSSLHVKCRVTPQGTAVRHKREIMVHLSGSEGPAGAH